MPAIFFKLQFVNPLIGRYLAGFREDSLIIMVSDDRVMSGAGDKARCSHFFFHSFFLKLIITCRWCVIYVRNVAVRSPRKAVKLNHSLRSQGNIGIPTVEIRRSYGSLISTMGFSILFRHFYIESGPRPPQGAVSV